MSDLDLTNPYDPDAFERRPQPPRPAVPAAPPARPAADELSPSPPTRAQAPGDKAGEGLAPWKAAASSVPRLRQQPVSPEPVDPDGSFQGFAQDALPTRGSGMTGQPNRSDAEAGLDDPPAPARPLSVEPPVWEAWLDRVRALPPAVTLGAGALLLAVVLSFVLRPGQQGSVSLARIRQHPEAFDGRHVAVQGKAGETFLIGGNYVFNLRQGRDTIVVYSRTRRPSLHESVRATGMVSIGYLDGAPRLALIEETPTP
ncbi:MAG: hypothetical protein ACRENJ_04235 [Candidatus Eiseniibacteriota bacterium]